MYDNHNVPGSCHDEIHCCRILVTCHVSRNCIVHRGHARHGGHEIVDCNNSPSHIIPMGIFDPDPGYVFTYDRRVPVYESFNRIPACSSPDLVIPGIGCPPPQNHHDQKHNETRTEAPQATFGFYRRKGALCPITIRGSYRREATAPPD